MSTQATTHLDSSSVALKLGMCAAALAGTAATVTDANAVVISFNTPIVIPATTAGIYINLLTGATGSSATAVPGWDFNPYLATTGSQLGFYWDQSRALGGGVGTTTATTPGTGTYTNLAPGATVSSASTFTSAVNLTAGSPFLTTGTHLLGFKFYNEATSAVDYGYLTMTNTGTNGFPATITGWKFENNGGAITIPSAVPEPSTAGMLALGALALGAANLRKIRRQRRRQAN